MCDSGDGVTYLFPSQDTPVTDRSKITINTVELPTIPTVDNHICPSTFSIHSRINSFHLI